VYNNVFAVATMALKKVDANLHHITTRYFFSQLWCEFTKEVLTEFLEEDSVDKEQELNSFSVKNINESSILPMGELIKGIFICSFSGHTVNCPRKRSNPTLPKSIAMCFTKKNL
jgi:hypothetical protein